MEDWETESLSLCVGSQVRLKAEWVDRWHERLDDVERRTRHRGVLGHVTPVHTHTHSTHNVHRSDVTNSGEQRSVAVCFHCLKFCTQDGFIVHYGFTRHYGVHKKPAFDGICSPRMSHLQVCISDKNQHCHHYHHNGNDNVDNSSHNQETVSNSQQTVWNFHETV